MLPVSRINPKEARMKVESNKKYFLGIISGVLKEVDSLFCSQAIDASLLFLVQGIL